MSDDDQLPSLRKQAFGRGGWPRSGGSMAIIRAEWRRVLPSASPARPAPELLARTSVSAIGYPVRVVTERKHPVAHPKMVEYQTRLMRERVDRQATADGFRRGVDPVDGLGDAIHVCAGDRTGVGGLVELDGRADGEAGVSLDVAVVQSKPRPFDGAAARRLRPAGQPSYLISHGRTEATEFASFIPPCEPHCGIRSQKSDGRGAAGSGCAGGSACAAGLGRRGRG